MDRRPKPELAPAVQQQDQKQRQRSAEAEECADAGTDAGTERQEPASTSSAAAVTAAGTDSAGGGGNIKDNSSAGPVPRSAWLRAQLNSHEWSALVSVANHNGYDFSAEGDVAIRRCGKTILEADRNAAAREAGYQAVLGKLVPLRASPMNDVLLGWPAAAEVAQGELTRTAAALGEEEKDGARGCGSRSGSSSSSSPFTDLSLAKVPHCAAGE